MAFRCIACTILTLAAWTPWNARGDEPVLSFSGSDSYVLLGVPDALQIPSNDPFTVEGWMSFSALSTRDILYSKNNSRGSPYTYMLGFADHKLAAYNTAWRGNFDVDRELDRWYHVAFSFDGSDMAFYLDGALLGTVAFSFNNNAAHTVKIGGFHTTSDINGSKSDVRVWDHARGQADIQAGMSNRLTGAESGLLGYWPMNEGAGETLCDRSAGGSDGEIIGASWTRTETLPVGPSAAGFDYGLPFYLADIETGSTEFTNSNVVDLADFPIPEGFDRYQINSSPSTNGIDTNQWVATNDLPETASFPIPPANTNFMLYAWFTNSADTVTVRRAEARIAYTTNPPVPVARLNHSRTLIPGQPVVIDPEEIDNGSTGGSTGGEAIPIHAMSLNWLDGPDVDATPEEAFVTVSEIGSYEIELVIMNAAGNVATSSVCDVDVVEYSGDPFEWTGAADDDWFNSLNWNLYAIPFEGSVVVIGQGASVLLSGPTPMLQSVTMAGTLTVSGWASALSAQSVVIAGKVTHLPQSATTTNALGGWDPDNRVWIVCHTFELTSDAEIDVDGMGYRGGNIGEDGAGPGGGRNHGTGAAGGSYGGVGGRGWTSAGSAYGVPHGPWEPGSGGGGGGAYGGIGGNGGGVVRITVSGAAEVNGTISAEGGGATSRAGGGSGGGIWITCGTFSGTSGVVRAEGSRAPANGGGGGGGRMALEITDSTAQANLDPHRVTFSTMPGSSASSTAGDIGSLYLSDLALLDGAWLPHTGGLHAPDWHSWALDTLHVSGWLRIAPSNATYFTLSVEGDSTFIGENAHLELIAPQLSVGGNMTLTNRARLTLQAVATNLPPSVSGSHGWVGVTGELAIAENSWMHPRSEPFTGSIVRMEAGGLRIDENGGIDADDSGFHRGVNSSGYSAHGYGPGHGRAANANGSGGGYGGRGGRSAGTALRGITYGDPFRPLLPGSGGGGRTGYAGMAGGDGGGLICLDIHGTALVNGVLSVNGQQGRNHGGGSGGAILLQCRQLLGGPNALLSADGGAGRGVNDGGGGGGRIAIWYGDSYRAGMPQHRIKISETPPPTFQGPYPSVQPGEGYEHPDAAESGTVRFVRVLYPSGVLMSIR